MVNVELFKAKLVYFLNNRHTSCRIYKCWHDDVVIWSDGIKDEFGNKYTLDDFVPCIEPFYQYQDDEFPTIRFFLKADVEAFDLKFDDKGNRIKIEAETFMEVVR